MEARVEPESEDQETQEIIITEEIYEDSCGFYIVTETGELEGVWEDRPEDIEEDFADNLVVTETGVSVGLGEEELKEVGPKKTIK